MKAKSKRYFTEISPAEFYEAYKHEPDLIAVADMYGFERRSCVEVRGTDDAQIAIIHPRYPRTWAKEFNQIVSNIEKNKNPVMPDYVLATLRSTSDGKTMEVIAIYKGERGYRKTTYGRQTMQWVDEMNSRLGIDEATMLAYEACSLFGRWENYDEIKQKMGAKVINV